MTTIATLVPIVDCSSAIGQQDMTEEERELCLQTVGFEDFVLQFIDRCFSLVSPCLYVIERHVVLTIR